MILPQAILDAPPLGCFNLHASLLPRWRGAAPINRAIMAGDAETGVMVMKMDAGLDTGDVAMAERLAISDTMTASDLHDAAGPARRRSDGARHRRARPRRIAVDEAGERGRDLCRQDREGRGADRLGQAGTRGAAPHPRPVALSRRLERGGGRGRAGPGEDPALRAGGWRRRAGSGAGRPPDDRVRQPISSCSAPARRP